MPGLSAPTAARPNLDFSDATLLKAANIAPAAEIAAGTRLWLAAQKARAKLPAQTRSAQTLRSDGPVKRHVCQIAKKARSWFRLRG